MDNRVILLAVLGISALVFVLVWISNKKCQREGFDTNDRPFPMYRNNTDHEGTYKYLDEYVMAISDNPFLRFPPTDNYTSRWYALRRKYNDFVGMDQKFFK